MFNLGYLKRFIFVFTYLKESCTKSEHRFSANCLLPQMAAKGRAGLVKARLQDQHLSNIGDQDPIMWAIIYCFPGLLTKSWTRN